MMTVFPEGHHGNAGRRQARYGIGLRREGGVALVMAGSRPVNLERCGDCYCIFLKSGAFYASLSTSGR